MMDLLSKNSVKYITVSATIKFNAILKGNYIFRNFSGKLIFSN